MGRETIPSRISGELITIPWDSDKVIVEPTVMCSHCGKHWVWKPGSGRRRGFCMRCNGFICGAPGCETCRPMEQLLENMEAGKPLEHTRIIVRGS